MLFAAPKGRVGCLTGSIRQGSRHTREWVPNLPVRRPHPAGVAAGRVLERGVKGEAPRTFSSSPEQPTPLSFLTSLFEGPASRPFSMDPFCSPVEVG